MVRVWCAGKGREEKGYSQIVITHHLFILLHRHFLQKVLKIGVSSVWMVLGDTLLAVSAGF